MKKMLIIEDDKIVGNIYRHKFQAAGFQVELAADGEAGLAAVERSKPDLVVLDLMLPKLNGVEVLKKLRSEEGTRNLPVIVLSNAYMSSLVQEALNAGATQCMTKASCTPRQLVEIVQRLLAPAAPAAAPVPTSATQGAQPVAATAGEGREEEAAFQAHVRRQFIESVPDQITQLRAMLQTFVKSEGDTARLQQLFALYRKAHSFTSNAAVAGLGNVARMASALEAFLKELYEKPKNITASTSRTVAHAIDFLAVLADHGATGTQEDAPPPNILVVDDEPISRRAVIFALEKANLKCVGLEDAATALKMLGESQFDLIFLDVDMPGMSGFDLCSKLRAIPAHARTPVIFVTGLTDFESRARSTLSGGNDLIAKPFLFMELAVKALTYILRAQLGINRP